MTPVQMPAMHQVDMRDTDAGLPLPALNLDHSRVLSQWEKMGGKVEFNTDAMFPESLSVPLDASNCFRPGDGGMYPIIQGGLDGAAPASIWVDLGNSVSVEALHQAQLVAGPGCRSAVSDLDGLVGEWQLSENGQLLYDDFGWAAADARRVAVAGEQTTECWIDERLADTAIRHSDRLEGIKQWASKAASTAPSFKVVAACPAAAPTQPQAQTPRHEARSYLERAAMSSPFPTATSMGVSARPGATSFIVPMSTAPSCMQGMNSAKDVRTRTQCLQRYREKKARRLYTKKIRYELRKINADRRPRIKGRFVRKEELEEYLRQQRLPKEKMGARASTNSKNDFEDSDNGEDTAVGL